MQAWQLNLEPKSEFILRMHECAHECRNFKTNHIARRRLHCKCVRCHKKANSLLYRNQSTYHALNKTLHTNISDCHGWTEEGKTVKNINLELFDPQVRFLTLAAAWRRLRILECNKQGGKAPRLHLGSTPPQTKNFTFEKVPTGSQAR